MLPSSECPVVAPSLTVHTCVFELQGFVCGSYRVPWGIRKRLRMCVQNSRTYLPMAFVFRCLTRVCTICSPKRTLVANLLAVDFRSMKSMHIPGTVDTCVCTTVYTLPHLSPPTPTYTSQRPKIYHNYFLVCMSSGTTDAWCIFVNDCPSLSFCNTYVSV